METPVLLSEKCILGFLCLTVIVAASCSFSVRPVYNSQKSNASEAELKPTVIYNRDDLKAKAIEQVKLLHRLMQDQNFEEAYQMVDDKSPLKLPKEESLKNMQEVVDTLGRLEKIDLTRDSVVEDKSLNGGQLQVRQEFIVTFEKDTPSPKRYEMLIWNVYSDDTFKLMRYVNAKGDD